MRKVGDERPEKIWGLGYLPKHLNGNYREFLKGEVIKYIGYSMNPYYHTIIIETEHGQRLTIKIKPEFSRVTDQQIEADVDIRVELEV